MSFAVALVIVMQFDSIKEDALGIIFFGGFALFFLDLVMYTFCEVRVAGEHVYVYSMWTRFKVVMIPVANVNFYNSYFLQGQGYIKFAASERLYTFKCIRNGYEFEQAMNVLRGVSDGYRK